MSASNTQQNFSQSKHCLFDISDDDFRKMAPAKTSIIITDENVARLYHSQWQDYRVLSFPAGEDFKTFKTLESLTEDLLGLGANRQTRLIAIGGGVVTDLVGYLAASFMRGVKCAFLPTTVLAQVDAAIGGKNGVNVGLHKNMLGTVRQPEFIAINAHFLKTLPDADWGNGFAEIIKYGFIEDREILDILDAGSLNYFQGNQGEFTLLIKRCVSIKNNIVGLDEFETGERQKLNFGHTVGHALETLYKLPHGHAIGLGMRVAIGLSEVYSGLDDDAGQRLVRLLEKYGLPTNIEIEEDRVMAILLSDKKRSENGINFVLLDEVGRAFYKVLSAAEIQSALGILR